MTIVVGAQSPGADTRKPYTWGGRRLTSVTTWPKLAVIEWGLHRWQVSNLVSHVIASADDIGLRVATGDEREIKELRSRLWNAVNGDDRNRIRGIAVHRAAELGKRPEDVHPAVAPLLAQYLDWLTQSGAEVIASEFKVWNLAEGYAGTGDLLVRFPSGQIWLVDLKSGNSLQAIHTMQLVAYLMGEFVGADDVVDGPLTEVLGQVAGLGILHLGEAGWEFATLKSEALPEIWTAYRSAIRFNAFLTEHRELAGLIEARRWSDGRTTDLVAVAEQAGTPTPDSPALVDAFGEMGWKWARIENNLAHLVPPHGDMSLCLRVVERSRRTLCVGPDGIGAELGATEPERACARCLTAREAGRGAAA